MQIKSVSILGLGLIGGSIAKALKHAQSNIYISAFDTEEILDKAITQKVIDKKLDNYRQALESNAIFICLPINEAVVVFQEISPLLKDGQVLTDVCSVKSVFTEIWSKVDSPGTYIGGHPMAGKENGGFDNSDRLLFENSIYILTEDLANKPELGDFRNLIESLGSNILHVPAKQHDVIAASVSHLPQIVSVALVNTSSLKTDNYNFLDLAAGGFRDMTRIASSDFNIWESIIAENRSEIITAIEEFQIEIEKIKKAVKTNNFPALKEEFSNARKNREEIPKNTKGFLKPLYDIFIFVQDEPGVLSKITTALYKNGISIEDIELLKVREGSGGNFRLSFETDDIAEKAKRVLSEYGFKTT